MTTIFEPPHDKTNQMTCEPSEDSDQTEHPPSLIRDFAVRMKKPWVLSYPLSASEDSDQTRRMPRLILVFAGRTVNVGFIISRLNYSITKMPKLQQNVAAALTFHQIGGQHIKRSIALVIG